MVRICKYCNKEFIPKYKQQLYCEKEHQRIAARIMVRERYRRIQIEKEKEYEEMMLQREKEREQDKENLNSLLKNIIKLSAELSDEQRAKVLTALTQ